MKKFFVFLFIFVSIFSFSGCKNKDNLNNLSANLTNYEISVDLNCETKKAKVYQEIDYINSTGEILKTLKLHLYPQYFKEGATESVVSSTKLNQAYPHGMSYSQFEVTKVLVETENTSVIYEGEHNGILCVNLKNSLLPEKRINLEIEYEFTIPNCEHRFGYGESCINLANFYPIMCVYENGEFNTSPYNSNGDPFYSEMSNYVVSITSNKQYIVAGAGEKTVENLDNNLAKTTFKAKLVRDFAMVLSSKFNVINSTINNTLIEYYYHNDAAPELSLKAGVDAIKTFSNLFGEYPYSTFSIVQTDFVHGGMEYPNLIMISDDIDNQTDYLNVIIHETAHQWWYGIVGNDEYKYPWLDEALTEFSTILFYDNNDGYNLSHKEMISASKENYTLFISVYEDVLGKIDTSMRAVDKYSTEPEYTYCTYVKGVLMYDSLYHLVGKDKFYKSLRKYYENNKFTNTTPNSLIDSFNSACKQDLTNFFESWLSGKVVIR